jgi:hypothetical protein
MLDGTVLVRLHVAVLDSVDRRNLPGLRGNRVSGTKRGRTDNPHCLSQNKRHRCSGSSPVFRNYILCEAR